MTSDNALKILHIVALKLVNIAITARPAVGAVRAFSFHIVLLATGMIFMGADITVYHQRHSSPID